ncbi:hypothetical protein ACOMHN_030696 [Nucella lapillus]
MAAVLRHWREASTLIIVTARQKGPEIKPHFVSSNGRPTSASSIKGKNFEVLLLKRNAKSKFMPNLYVFPGGVADDVDFSSEWISVFDLLGKDHRKRVFDFAQRGGQGAPIFSRVRDEQFRQIPTEIAFRICAIRETFEESGVLIAADNSVQKEVDTQQSLWNRESWAFYIQDTATASLKEWRKRVIADPRQFLYMCQELSLVPDVWSLYEWSNWLTPQQSSRRFDTAFFVCCLQGRPLVAEDEQEAVHSQWGSPYSSLQEYYQGRVGLAPPQVYELGRLLEFSAVPELLTFAWRRGEHRVDRWLPVRVTTADNVMSVLPDLFSTESFSPDYTASVTLRTRDWWCFHQSTLPVSL